jgi:exopolyphosphatase
MTFLDFLKSKISSPKRVFTGNEAADLDSTVSAAALAYFYELTEGKQNLPIVNIPRKEFRLRTDIIRAFKDAFAEDATVAMDSLTFADEVQLNGIKDLELVLTDHNALAKGHAVLDAKIVGIVDHHADQGIAKDAPLRIIDLECGSATSHVVLLFKNHSLAKEWLEKDASFAKLLLAPILVDTINLKPELGRCFPVDVEASNYLVDLIKPPQGKEAYLDATFTALQEAKFDVSSLNSDDLLRKDYKQIAANGRHIGMSSVTWNFAAWSESESSRGLNVGEEIVEFARANNLSSEIVMTAYEYSAPRGFAREMAIAVSPDSQLLLTGLEKDARMQMIPLSVGQLSKHDIIDKDGTPWTLSVYEINPAFSRKKVLPIVQEVASKL